MFAVEEEEEATFLLLALRRCKKAAVADVDDDGAGAGAPADAAEAEAARSLALLACRFAARSAWNRFRRAAVVFPLVDADESDAATCALLEGFDA